MNHSHLKITILLLAILIFSSFAFAQQKSGSQENTTEDPCVIKRKIQGAEILATKAVDKAYVDIAEEVGLRGYWIGEFLVSNDQFCQFVDQTEFKTDTEQALHFDFDGELDKSLQYTAAENVQRGSQFTRGLVKQALRVGSRVGENRFPSIASLATNENSFLNSNSDFSIEFWVRTTVDADGRFVLLSQKQIPDNSLKTQKQKGWAFGFCNGTWSWHIGSGNRRLTYERENGQHMPINDGRWHQLVMTHDHSNSIVRLYYDGTNWVTYNLADKDGFDFSNESPLSIGWSGDIETDNILPAIEQGAENLQKLVDAFDGLGLGDLQPDELMNLVIGPKRLVLARRKQAGDATEEGKAVEKGEVPKEKLDEIEQLVRALSRNPYTVHQVADFMQVAPLLKLYRLVDGQIEVNQKKANEFTAKERLMLPDFDIDELSITPRALGADEVLQRYSKHFQVAVRPQEKKPANLIAAAFNIHHGGKHETVEEDGWDSRVLIAEIIRRENIDVVMMQETYSSGDFIAAELGYYFATTVDWDYLNQGANVSVLSRYPIEEISVPPNSSFMNVAARCAISETQDVYVMSNWYGMNNFNDVFEYHESKFSQSDNIPVLFAGDFNAVPHTDGGGSPASKRLLDAGFRDAYRESFPDVKKHPGASHQSGSRIDQLYYKGSRLKHVSTKVLSTWACKFPSDHFLIKSVFEFDFETKDDEN